MISELYMQRALELAALGKGRTPPNPMVGAVVVYKDQIIGEGWHKKAGTAHAEVVAINNVKNKRLLSLSTIYVTLEPCSHFGKTPPCSDLIIQHNIPKVVIACTDPNPLVAGKGIEKLKNAGIDVTIGVLEKKSISLNKRFFTFHSKKRPYIVLKWAQSDDGFIDPRSDAQNGQIAISGKEAKVLTHKWRSEEQAILVGTKTAEVDNPKLDSRLWSKKAPIRIVIDKSLKLSKALYVFNNKALTLVFNNIKNDSESNVEFIKTDSKNYINTILETCFKKDIQSVFIEGGQQTLQQFIDADAFDEIRVYVSQQKLNSGLKAPVIDMSSSIEESIGKDKILLLIK